MTNFISGLLLVMMAAVFIFSGAGTSAQTLGLEETAKNAQFRIESPEEIIGNVIYGLLAFLGLIGFVLVIYAGGLWMTAAGNEKQVEQAQEILKAAVIGLVIIFISFVTTVAVIDLLSEKTLK